MPRPEVLSGDNEGVELTWRQVGLTIHPSFAVIFRPVLPSVDSPKPGEEWEFRLPGEEGKLAAAVYARLDSREYDGWEEPTGPVIASPETLAAVLDGLHPKGPSAINYVTSAMQKALKK